MSNLCRAFAPYHRALPVAPDVDIPRLHAYRLERIRGAMQAQDVALCVLVNPVSLRYAADWRGYALFQSHIPSYYLFLPVEGPIVLFGTSAKPDIVDEVRPARGLNTFDAGLKLDIEARKFAREVQDFLREIAADNRRVACERLSPSAIHAIADTGIEVVDADGLMESARYIKSADEIACMRYSVEVAELGMQRMRDLLAPGITENELWSVLHHTNIAYDGDWIDGRMLASGTRTNPWLQEASAKVIEAGDLVAFDTDMVGPNGYCADISRTFFCGTDKPSSEQKLVYRRAYAEIQHNIDLLRPGMTFKEFSERAYRQDDEFVPRRYPCVAHGVGMSDEYPKIYYHADWGRSGYDGVIEADTVMSIESYVGSIHGTVGVKLEEMVHIRADGCEVLCKYPFEEALLHG